ncbi:MAG: hydrogenase expression/formation protein HypE [Gammaproteobacteria bacterium]|nr:hydrogenase expression/formation protein HypE [Gammaproteobacteria bacterium]
MDKSSKLTHTTPGEFITLSQGNGGTHSQALIKNVIASALRQPPNLEMDAAPLPALTGPLYMSSDSYTVQPLFFPGGSIGSLAIHGTVNDLAVAGAKARALSLALIIEEGFPLADLRQILSDLSAVVEQTQVQILCGDTKVVPRGQGSGVYLNTTGIGEKILPQSLGMEHIRPGDVIVASGPIGDHGATVLMAREEFGLSSQLQSDCASVFPLVECLSELDGLRFMRDPTRGGLASVMYEIFQATHLGIVLQQNHIPLRMEVRSFCEILGLEPWHLACEGRVIAVIAAQQADALLKRWQMHPLGEMAEIIGEISAKTHPPLLQTPLGGQRILPPLEDDPMPRIC